MQAAERPASPPARAAEAPATPARGAVWPWVLGVLVVLGGAVALMLWRRRQAREDAWENDAYPVQAYEEPLVRHEAAAEESAPAVVPPSRRVATPFAPMAAADPVLATVEDASVVQADAEEVAALTAAQPASDRPWLELAIRPVRAGTTEDHAQVDIELTVGNAGAVAAEAVRIATFMLADVDDGEIERMLVNPPVADAVEPVRIAAGEGARVDATLTLPRERLEHENRFRPVVVAEARYRLPGGGEGRTVASFDVGVTSDPELPLPPITTAGTELRDDVEARLHRAAEHA